MSEIFCRSNTGTCRLGDATRIMCQGSHHHLEPFSALTQAGVSCIAHGILNIPTSQLLHLSFFTDEIPVVCTGPGFPNILK